MSDGGVRLRVDSSDGSVRVLYVLREGERERSDERSDGLVSLAAAVVESVAELDDVLDTDARFDCVVSWYDLADGTGTDVLDRVATRHPDIPVVLLVDAADGRVPAEAVSREFAASVPIEETEQPIDRLHD